MNSAQRAILSATAAIVCLMILFPPFFDAGGLFGGVQIAFLLRPPAPNPALDVRPALALETLLLQIAAVACFGLAAALAFDSSARRLRARLLMFGLFLAQTPAAAGRRRRSSSA